MNGNRQYKQQLDKLVIEENKKLRRKRKAGGGGDVEVVAEEGTVGRIVEEVVGEGDTIHPKIFAMTIGESRTEGNKMRRGKNGD